MRFMNNDLLIGGWWECGCLWIIPRSLAFRALGSISITMDLRSKSESFNTFMPIKFPLFQSMKTRATSRWRMQVGTVDIVDILDVSLNHRTHHLASTCVIGGFNVHSPRTSRRDTCFWDEEMVRGMNLNIVWPL